MLMIQNSFDANPPKFIKVFDGHYLLATLCPDGFGSGGFDGDVIAEGFRLVATFNDHKLCSQAPGSGKQARRLLA